MLLNEQPKPIVAKILTEAERCAFREEWRRLHSGGIFGVPVVEVESLPTPANLFLAPFTNEVAARNTKESKNA